MLVVHPHQTGIHRGAHIQDFAIHEHAIPTIQLHQIGRDLEGLRCRLFNARVLGEHHGVHHAVGTAAALGWPIALSGALGYLISGWSAQGLPAHTLGFWYIPLAAIMAVTTILIAPLGVRVAHLLPAAHLKRAVGILMLVIAAQMLWKW